jgi:predicted nucleic acid-binding protein
MLAVTNTSPLHYLILIGQEDLLPLLYEQVLVPRAVVDELQHPRTPVSVRTWINTLPPWCAIRQPHQTRLSELLRLGAGERDAILLAEELQVDIVLLDDDAGRKAAQRRALRRTGTLGILGTAGARGLVDFPATVARLQMTSFRMPPLAVVQDMLTQYAIRKQQGPERI